LINNNQEVVLPFKPLIRFAGNYAMLDQIKDLVSTYCAHFEIVFLVTRKYDKKTRYS